MILKQLIRYDNAPIIEVTWVDENDVVVKCHAYGVAEFDQLREELGDDAPTYQELMDEIAATYVPPPPPPAEVPSSVSRAQGKAALISAGYWPTVLAFVESIGDPVQKALAEVALNDTLEWRRDSAFLNACAAASSLSQNDLDALFLSASEIQF